MYGDARFLAQVILCDRCLKYHPRNYDCRSAKVVEATEPVVEVVEDVLADGDVTAAEKGEVLSALSDADKALEVAGEEVVDGEGSGTEAGEVHGEPGDAEHAEAGSPEGADVEAEPGQVAPAVKPKRKASKKG